MLISENIPLDVETVLWEMHERQGLPWNNGRINDYCQFRALNELFEIINSGIPKEDFMFQGALFRIHTPYITFSEDIDPLRERLISKIYEDDSCFVLPITEYSEGVVAFSKSSDFTKPVFYKVNPSEKAVFLYVNTGSLFGIDVNQFYHRYAVPNDRFKEEMEVLFPLAQGTLVKEYWCTPNKFKYYMRGHL